MCLRPLGFRRDQMRTRDGFKFANCRPVPPVPTGPHAKLFDQHHRSRLRIIRAAPSAANPFAQKPARSNTSVMVASNVQLRQMNIRSSREIIGIRRGRSGRSAPRRPTSPAPCFDCCAFSAPAARDRSIGTSAPHGRRNRRQSKSIKPRGAKQL